MICELLKNQPHESGPIGSPASWPFLLDHQADQYQTVPHLGQSSSLVVGRCNSLSEIPMPDTPTLVLNSQAMVSGTVTGRSVRTRAGGPPFVTARITRPEWSPVDVVWWEEDDAPKEGAHVRVTGKVVSSPDGRSLQVWVRNTRCRPEPEDATGLHPHQRVISYLLGCVETEAALATMFELDDRDHLRLETGQDPAFTLTPEDPLVPLQGDLYQRCTERLADGEDSVALGYPTILGIGTDGDARLSPLYLVECEIVRLQDGLALRRKDHRAEIFNPYALDLLDLSRDKREQVRERLNDAPQLAESKSPCDRMSEHTRSAR